MRHRMGFRGVERVLHLAADYQRLPDLDTHTYVALASKGHLTGEAPPPGANYGVVGEAQALVEGARD